MNLQLQQQLKGMIEETGSVLHEPYVTTKHGQLRSKRKSNKDPLSAVDDLATLENLDEVDKNHKGFGVSLGVK